jgi:hypothetical protein
MIVFLKRAVAIVIGLFGLVPIYSGAGILLTPGANVIGSSDSIGQTFLGISVMFLIIGIILLVVAWFLFSSTIKKKS